MGYEKENISNKGDLVRLQRDGNEQKLQASTEKAMRTVLLAVLFHLIWPQPMRWEELLMLVPQYGKKAKKAFYRDIETLTQYPVTHLPAPDAENLGEWCEQQRKLGRLALTYNAKDGTFVLAQSFFTVEIDDDQARAFVALQDGFEPGTPYAQAIQMLLHRWQWLFSTQSQLLVQQKRKRKMRPVRLPLSPVSDYSQHEKVILALDAALEECAYISFLYTPQTRTWDDQPEDHQHLEPYELEYRDGHWYLTAYVQESNRFLDFRVDRIWPTSLRRNGNHYAPLIRTRPGVHIRYWVTPEMARHGTLSTRLQKQTLTLLEQNKGAIVEGDARSIWWAARLLLGYGENVKALEPAELVQTMRERTNLVAQHYT